MKPVASTSLLFVVVLFAADSLRALIQNALFADYFALVQSGSWLGNSLNYVLINVLIYTVVVAAAGGVLAWRVSGLPRRVLLALALGLALCAVNLFFGPAQPFTWITHAPLWLETLFWANWYVPVLAAPAGALLYNVLLPAKKRIQNAA
jgi:hypothetical protein